MVQYDTRMTGKDPDDAGTISIEDRERQCHPDHTVTDGCQRRRPRGIALRSDYGRLFAAMKFDTEKRQDEPEPENSGLSVA